jgi:hypothetical protein
VGERKRASQRELGYREAEKQREQGQEKMWKRRGEEKDGEKSTMEGVGSGSDRKTVHES